MDPELSPPFRWEGDHIGAALPGGRVLFTTRRGGVSGGPYASLNLGWLTDDEPAAVAANRAHAAAAVRLPWERFCWGHQVHGAVVYRATRPGGRPEAEQDGQATALTAAAPVVLVADCLPIALAADGAVAMLHGGWRGLAAGIVAEGVAALRELGAQGPIAAAIGPGARGCCYEVGEEVHARFAGHDARRGARGLDLAAVAADQLRAAGVATVHDVGLCTLCVGPRLFFSHRRDGGVTGRQAGIAWRS